MIGDLDKNDPRLKGNPSPEEVQRITDDILKDFRAKHSPDPLTDTQQAVARSKAIHIQIVNEAQKETEPFTVPDPALWRSRLMDAYRKNFEHHLSKEQMIEVLAVMHTEMALEIIL
jgi:hypothetical protein